jgi:hypothetical protein
VFSFVKKRIKEWMHVGRKRKVLAIKDIMQSLEDLAPDGILDETIR